MLDEPDHDLQADPLEHAWDLLAEGDLNGALSRVQQCLADDEDSPDGHNLMGYILAAGGELEAALEHYRAAVSADASFVEAILNAADILMQLGDVQAALDLTEDAIDAAESDDDVAEALLLRVDALLFAGLGEEARKAAAQLPVGPFESPTLDFLVGRARFETGDLEGAAVGIEQAAHTDPHNPDVFYYLGLLRESQDDIRGATVAFLQCRDLDLSGPRPAWAMTIPQFEKRAQAAIRRLPAELSAYLEDALIVVDEVPGAEVVSEGVDPRIPMVLDDLPLGKGDTLRRVFIYQRNIERTVPTPDMIEDELYLVFRSELESRVQQ